MTSDNTETLNQIDNTERIEETFREEFKFEEQFTFELVEEPMEEPKLEFKSMVMMVEEMEFEEEFGIEIPDEDAENITTVGSAVDYIEKVQE